MLFSSDDKDGAGEEGRVWRRSTHPELSAAVSVSGTHAGPTADNSVLSRKEPSAVLIRAREKERRIWVREGLERQG